MSIMSIMSNRDGLKALSDFSLDSQIVNRLGNKIFNHQGPITSEIQADCEDLKKVLTEFNVILNNINSKIPVTNK